MTDQQPPRRTILKAAGLLGVAAAGSAVPGVAQENNGPDEEADPEPDDITGVEGLETVERDESYDEVLESVEDAAEESEDIDLVATIDHQEELEAVDQEVPPTAVVYVANPELGASLLEENQAIGIELPQRLLVWEADDEPAEAEPGAEDEPDEEEDDPDLENGADEPESTQQDDADEPADDEEQGEEEEMVYVTYTEPAYLAERFELEADDPEIDQAAYALEQLADGQAVDPDEMPEPDDEGPEDDGPDDEDPDEAEPEEDPENGPDDSGPPDDEPGPPDDEPGPPDN